MARQSPGAWRRQRSARTVTEHTRFLAQQIPSLRFSSSQSRLPAESVIAVCRRNSIRASMGEPLHGESGRLQSALTAMGFIPSSRVVNRILRYQCRISRSKPVPAVMRECAFQRNLVLRADAYPLTLPVITAWHRSAARPSLPIAPAAMVPMIFCLQAIPNHAFIPRI